MKIVPCEHIKMQYDKSSDKQKFCRFATNKCTPKINNMTRHHWSYNRDDLIDIIYVPNSLHATFHGKIYYDKNEMKFRAGHIHFYWMVPRDQLIKPGELLDTKFKHIRFLVEIRKYIVAEDLYFKDKYGWEPRDPKLLKKLREES